MESVSLKLEKEFLAAIENVMRKHNYMTKTEFIREAIREKVKRLEVSEPRENIQRAEKRDYPSYI